MSLISYAANKNKSVLLASFMHHSIDVDPQSGKPEIIAAYNSSKGRVKALDQKCANYSVSWQTMRWPFFSATLNIYGVNANVLTFLEKTN